MNEVFVRVSDDYEKNRAGKARAMFRYLSERGLLDASLPAEWDKLLQYQRDQFTDMVSWYAEPTVVIGR